MYGCLGLGWELSGAGESASSGIGWVGDWRDENALESFLHLLEPLVFGPLFAFSFFFALSFSLFSIHSAYIFKPLLLQPSPPRQERCGD